MQLKISKVSKRFGNKWVLKDIILEVNEGEVLGIFGRIASGKTTLLRLIAGIDKPNGGNVSLYQDESGHKAAHPAGIYFSEPQTRSRIQAIIGSSEKRSNGELGSAKIERALKQPDKVLLFDEPFAAIDIAERDRQISSLRHSADIDRRVVIIASNNFADLASACDRIAVLDNCEIAQIGSVQQIYEQPATSGVAKQIDGINIFPARRLSSSDSKLPEFQTIDGEHRLFARKTEKRDLGAINQTINLAIHSENISITFGASFPEDNLIKAVVVEINFNGPTSIVQLDAGGLRLKARVFRVVGLNIGDECMIGLPPNRILILKD